MSTRVLKWITGTLIALGFAIMAGWPIFVGMPPKGGTRAQAKAYLTRGLIAATGLAIVVTGAGIGAFLVMRRTRAEYREESMKNLRTLLEGTREDQLRKQQRQDEESVD